MLPLTKRQREILDYLNEFIQQHGYAPSLEEIGRQFSLSSLATVHKHLTNLQEKGFIRRAWNRSRSVELVPTRAGGRALELPLLGFVAAGHPDRSGRRQRDDCRARNAGRQARQLRAARQGRLDDRRADPRRRLRHRRGPQDAPTTARWSSRCVGGLDVTLKKFYRENGRVRLQPANPAMQPIMVDPDQVQVQGVVVGVMRKY